MTTRDATPPAATTPRSVRLERPSDHVAELVLDRPEALNAISTAHARAIGAACAELTDDDRVRVVLLTSTSDQAFSVGADLKERRGMSTEQLLQQRQVTRTAYRGVLGLPMPVVAVVEGYALGGGFELALACDLIVAATTATFGLPEVGVGIVPGGGGTQLLTRRLGYNAAADIILTGRQLDAAEAKSYGIVDRLTEPGAARTVAAELADRLASRSPVAVRQAKIAMRHGLDLPLAEGLQIEERAWENAISSADRVEGVAAFVEKREPRWG
ncbi:enoyl-CoA hydratase/isomerase family protein [Propionibacteriaceae bacterium Y2011]